MIGKDRSEPPQAAGEAGPSERASPPIVRLSWGHLEVAGHRTFRDAKLFPVLPTEQAVSRYNVLCRTEPVGGLFHSTC